MSMTPESAPTLSTLVDMADSLGIPVPPWARQAVTQDAPWQRKAPTHHLRSLHLPNVPTLVRHECPSCHRGAYAGADAWVWCLGHGHTRRMDVRGAVRLDGSFAVRIRVANVAPVSPAIAQRMADARLRSAVHAKIAEGMRHDSLHRTWRAAGIV